MPEGYECLLLHLKELNLRRFKKILKWFFLSLLFLIAAVYIFIQSPFGQNWIARQVTKRLSHDLQTKITIKHVEFSLFNTMHLHGVLIEDRQGDTLVAAGDIKVRITDWFFFKKEADLKYIGLENAIIKFQRNDSVWSQQFFLDYFSSPKTGQKKKKAGIQFSLQKIEFKNVLFLQRDGWMGENMTVQLGTLNLDADRLSLAGNKYEINSLLLRDPVITLYNYKRAKPIDTTGSAVAEAVSAAWNRTQTIFQIGNLSIINGSFRSDKQNDRMPFSYFDGEHMLFTNINAQLSNSNFTGDTVFSKLKLTAKERSGLEIKNLSADLKLTPQGMIFSNLDLATNRSKIRKYFSMNYDDMRDMGNFIHKVKIAAIFEDSYVDSDDIAYFAPAMRTWKKKISLEGNLRGTVDNLSGRDMLIQAGSSTIIDGDISLAGLPDINQTFIDFKSNDFKTTYNDVATIIPAIRRITNPDLRAIQYVHFRGNFTGFIRDFVTFGTIQTNLGTVRTDINMKLPRGQDPLYSGKISTDNFRLGALLRNGDIGSIGMTGTVKGKGFNAKSRNIIFDGTVRFVEYDGYRYENIGIKGRLDKSLFEGVASVRDNNAEFDLNGIIDFNGPTPRFDLVADITKANLRELGLTKDTVGFRGKLNLNFTSNNIDNFLGTARVTEAEIIRNGHRLPFDSLVIVSNIVGNEKVLTVASNEFTANLSGNFNLKDLPNSFTYLLNKYYPAYVKAPKRFPKNQDIKFDITTYYADEFLQIFDPKIAGFNNSHLEGNLNLARNELNLTADVPQFKYGQFNFDEVKLVATGNNDSLVLSGTTRNIKLNDSLNIPFAVFHVNAHNDSSRVNITTGATQQLERANLNALVLTYNDGVEIEFDPSSFAVNGKTWSIDESGVLKFRKNIPANGQLLLTEGEQKILLKTQPSAKGNWNDLKVELSKVNLGDISPYFLPKNRLEGLVSGNVLVENPTNNLKIISDDIRTQYLRLDNDSLGEVKATVYYDNSSKELKVKGNTLNQENYLDFDAHIFFDPAKSKDNLIALKARNFQIDILERFLGNLFTDMRGFLTGDVTVAGEFSHLSVTGKGRLKDAGLRVNFTQVFYKIQDTDIELTPEKIDLDGIVLRDTVTNNPVYITGGIEHESFQNMFYNLDISTQRPNTTGPDNNLSVQLLRTSYKDNKQFYGDVKGTGSLTLAGPQSGMYMKIDAVASTTDSSYITLPPARTRESGVADFLVERKYGREMTEIDLPVSSTNIVYDVDITANPMVTAKVVLDELTGDEIKGRGSGTLNIRSGTSEPLSLRGRFDIQEGSYLFTFQSFFKKPFELKKEVNNYIEWNGDPYDANINFEAVYKAERVSFAPLRPLLQVNTGVTNARGDVYVVAKLTDKLFKPTIEFSLDFPNTSVAVTDPELALIIQQLQKDPNEINKQVTYLIVFNSFAPSEGLFGGQSISGAGLVTNTISGIFLNVISEQLNKILGNLFKNEKYNITLNTTLYNRNLIGNNATFDVASNVNFSIGRSFFNNRFIISTGVGLDAPLQQSNVQQSIQLLPDVTLEWLINQSGSIRASFFYRENADYLVSNISGGPGKARRYGANVSYRKDFDRLGDIFRRRRKIPQPLPVQPIVPTTVPADVTTKKEGEVSVKELKE
ncbi:MAG: translocation/assembly module TamB domain-containing protein [Chitinophagaceae bacterium]